MKKCSIRLNVGELMVAADKKNLTSDTEIAAAIGVSVTQLWRAKLPPTDERNSPPGTTFIAGVLDVFEGPFERFFFLEK